MPTPVPYYITTPIYYVNDRPHIGHCYTTLVADCAARFQRLAGRDVFFLTGTDEHAEKVVDSAKAHDMTPLQWADRNAAAFKDAFKLFNCSNNDFVRTTEPRHKEKVEAYVRKLQSTGDIYLGDYEGWYDPSQEEYVTETTARESNFKSPVTGRDLVKRTEKNYFFRLSKYQDALKKYIESNEGFLRPEARRNEVLGRLRTPEGLQDIPVSRAVDASDPRSAWGILMPNDPSHRIYVWIDALFNYLSVVDTNDRRKYWPANVHAIGKDILWFHAVIWPCLLMALGEQLPGCVYAHSYWIREGRKMSKSLGNFLDLETLKAYAEWAPNKEGIPLGIDALRWYLLTQGPLGATDADFAHNKFVEVYNADLANGIGNAASRVSNMIEKYFEGKCPQGNPAESSPMHSSAGSLLSHSGDAFQSLSIDGAYARVIAFTREIDTYITETSPFKLAKDLANMPRVGAILYNCAEAIRIAAVLLSPAMPTKMADLLTRLGQESPRPDGSFSKPLSELCTWGGLKPGTPITKGPALFPRAEADAAPPSAA
ncbi:MAG TPA: methionine--tRNA ligase [Phycisphaerales bacterium]|nr:methionine--tRNA ligase [Phycisphaerales bacterium]